MRKNLLFGYLTLLFLSICYVAKANHIYGGELIYKYISGNTYKIILNIYGDCSGTQFPTLLTDSPKVILTNGSSYIDTIVLTPDSGSNVEVTPVCPSAAGQTACINPTNPIPGIKKFIYTNTITVPYMDSNWHFIFWGYLSYANIAGRSSNISNVQFASLTYLTAQLNNTNGPNSSPVYSTVPSPFYCVNVAEQYNQGAIDPNGDSLVFSLVNALDGSTLGSPVTYYPPYSGANPLAVSPGSFTFDPLNGQMNFTPNMTQFALVDNRIYEYRNGVLVGTSIREMTFIVLGNCIGIPPSATIDTQSLVGGKIAFDDSNKVNVCVGTQNVSFNIKVLDNSGDTVNVIANDSLANSSISIINNNSNSPQILFNWQPGNSSIGLHNFFITLQDNHCPISDKQSIAYTINLVPPFSFADTLIAPTECYHQAYMHYDISGGVYPMTLIIQKSGSTIKSIYIDSAGAIYDSLAAGKYVAHLLSANLYCYTIDSFTIVDGGTLSTPGIITSTYCKNDPAQPIDFPIINGAIVTWYDTGGNVLPSMPTVSTGNTGIFYWYISQQIQSCKSGMDTVQVIVNDLPQIGFGSIPQNVCIGDTVYLRASGGVKYNWGPVSQVINGKNDSPAAIILASSTFEVQVTTQYGCSDTASVSVNDVEPCCHFSYPNAFTPNGDGKNDFFYVITYGHTENFELSIYNRWGQRVFHSQDQYNYWDGTFEGQACDIGTYSYYITAKCLTGKMEQHKGDVTLVR